MRPEPPVGVEGPAGSTGPCENSGVHGRIREDLLKLWGVSMIGFGALWKDLAVHKRIRLSMSEILELWEYFPSRR